MIMPSKAFSVLMSVYKNDNSDFLKSSIYSISIQQTVQPSEIILVIDGPIPDDLRVVIKNLENEIEYLRPIWLPYNKGLGNAMQVGLLECKNELIARMDSDDIANFDRFEKQLKMFENDEALGLVGSCISEFIDYPDQVVSRRIVPLTDQEIRKYIKIRCPFNHMTVMFKKSEVLKAGNYQDWHYNEDYFLWIRMMLSGSKFANIADSTVNVRVGKEMYARRGGLKYFKSEEAIQRLMLKKGLISFPLYIFNVIGRFSIQILMPNKIRGYIFQKIFRQ